MRYSFARAFLGSFALGAIGTLSLLVAALEVSVAAIPVVGRGAEPTLVNRTFKGDRTPALPGASRVLPTRPSNEPQLPEGCLAATDWRSSKIYSAEIPGRCLA